MIIYFLMLIYNKKQMPRNRMKLIRNAIGEIVEYGGQFLTSKAGPLIGSTLLKGQELAQKLGVDPKITEKLVNTGLEYVANKATSIQPGVFFNERIAPYGEKLLNDLVNNYNNNGGNSAYPQESYLSAPENPPGFDKYKYGPKSDLSLNDYFKVIRTRDDEKQAYLRKINTETERIKKLKSEGKDILSKETMDKLQAKKILEASKVKKVPKISTKTSEIAPYPKGSKKMINRQNTKLDKSVKSEPKISKSKKGEGEIRNPKMRRVRKKNPNPDIVVNDNNIMGLKEEKKKDKLKNVYTLVL